MVWPCKQNASEMASQISFTCESKGKRLVGRPRRHWPDYIEDLGEPLEAATKRNVGSGDGS